MNIQKELQEIKKNGATALEIFKQLEIEKEQLENKMFILLTLSLIDKIEELQLANEDFFLPIATINIRCYYYHDEGLDYTVTFLDKNGKSIAQQEKLLIDLSSLISQFNESPVASEYFEKAYNAPINLILDLTVEDKEIVKKKVIDNFLPSNLKAVYLNDNLEISLDEKSSNNKKNKL